MTSRTRVRLPAHFTGFEVKNNWTVGSNENLPDKSAAMTEQQETDIMRILINELQLKLALDLDSSPSNSRSTSSEAGPRHDGDEVAFLVVGSSNARRLEEAL